MLGSIAVRRYVDQMAVQGFEPVDVLLGSGLDYERLARTDCRITHSQYRTVVTRVLTMRGQDGLNLACSTFSELADLGIVGHASAASRTVRDTYRVWTRFGPTLLGMMGQLQIVAEDNATVTFGVASPSPDDPLYRFSVEELLTMVRKVSRTLDSVVPSVRALTFSYPTPPHSEGYAALFGCPIRFNAPDTTIQVYKEWFDQPAHLYDAEFNALCLQHCEKVLLRFDRVSPMTAELRWLFKRTKDGALPSLQDAAIAMHLSARTLRRRLDEEGTSYRDQINEFRAEQAKNLLAFGALSTKEVAYALGFTEPSAFRHAFKAWTGLSVKQYAASVSSPAKPQHNRGH